MSTLCNPALAGTSMMVLVEQCYASAYHALEEGSLDHALGLFGVMAAMVPQDERAWIGLGVIQEKNEQWPLAARLYGLGAAFIPTSVWCHFGKGRALQRLGKLAEAEQCFDIASSHTDEQALLQAIEEERAS